MLWMNSRAASRTTRGGLNQDSTNATAMPNGRECAVMAAPACSVVSLASVTSKVTSFVEIATVLRLMTALGSLALLAACEGMTPTIVTVLPLRRLF